MIYVFILLNFVILALLLRIHYVQRKKSASEMLSQLGIDGSRHSEDKGLSDGWYYQALYELKEFADTQDERLDAGLTNVVPIWHTTQQEMLQTLINYYRREAHKAHVIFLVQLSEQLSEEMIREFHLIHIVGNLLQNALEALQGLPAFQNRSMGLWIDCVNDELSVRVYNTYPEELRVCADLKKWSKQGYSTKSSERRDRGLVVLQKLVNDKDGILSLNSEQGISFSIEFAIERRGA